MDFGLEIAECPLDRRAASGGAKRKLRNSLPQDVLLFVLQGDLGKKHASVFASVRLDSVAPLGSEHRPENISKQCLDYADVEHVAWQFSDLMLLRPPLTLTSPADMSSLTLVVQAKHSQAVLDIHKAFRLSSWCRLFRVTDAQQSMLTMAAPAFIVTNRKHVLMMGVDLSLIHI